MIRPGAPAPITAIAPLDDLLAAHAEVLGGDLMGFRSKDSHETDKNTGSVQAMMRVVDLLPA